MTQFPTKADIIILIIFLIFSLISIQYYYHNSPIITKKMSNPDKIIDPYKHLHIIPNPNGTITRLQEFFPTIHPSISSSSTLSKDIYISPNTTTWVRVFLPRTQVDMSNSSSNPTQQSNKLPIVVFAHGGGFILFSAASPVFHNFCSELASQLNVLVISVEYRLAPESRLPAAYDDVLDVLHWVKEGKDEWVKKYGDLSNCYLMGQSAGANIMYFAGVNALDQVNDLRPLIIRGLILIQPFFGGLKRTGSELRLVNDPFLPLVVNDLTWDLALPIGANRGHEYCDPITHGGVKYLDRVRELGWRVLVVASDDDPLIDRQLELVKMFESNSLNLKTMLSKSGHHGVFASDPNKREEMFVVLDKFLKDL